MKASLSFMTPKPETSCTAMTLLPVKGGTHPDESTREKDALEHFSKAQPGRKSKTAVLHANPRTLKPRTLYKVDIKKRALMEHPLQLGRIPRAPKR